MILYVFECNGGWVVGGDVGVVVVVGYFVGVVGFSDVGGDGGVVFGGVVVLG